MILSTQHFEKNCSRCRHVVTSILIANSFFAGLTFKACVVRADESPEIKVNAESLRSELVAADSEEEAQAQLAYERFLNLVRRQPKQGTAFDRVFSFHVERGTLEDFIVTLQKESQSLQADIASKEQAGVAWMLLGLVEYQRGDLSEAADAFRQAETARPSDPFPSWYLGRCLIRIGQPNEAADALERAIQRKPEKSDLLQIYQELGRAWRRSQQPSKAADVWTRMELQFPNDLRVKEQIANLLYEEGDIDAALVRFSDLAKLHRDPYQASQYAMLAGELKLRLGKDQEALRDFEAQLQNLDPESWLFRDARRRIEQIFLRTDDQAGLIAYYEQWLQKHPEDLDAISRLARTLALRGRLLDARAWYTKAIERAPSNVKLRQALIEQLIREGLFDQAIRQYEQLHRFDNGNPDHIEEWGLLYLHHSDLSKAEQQKQAAKVWRLLLTDRENDPVAVVRVAGLLRRADLTTEALELFQKAVLLAPKEPQYREYLGEYLHSMNRRDEALAAWNSLASGEARTTENLVRLSEILQKFGYSELALDAMQAACELTPDFNEHIRFARMLREFEVGETLPRAEESLRQLNQAELLAESADDRQVLVNQRILSLIASGLLSQKTDELARKMAASAAAAGDDTAGDDTAEQWATLALYYQAADKLADSIDAINKSLRRDPDSVSSWTVAASLFEKAGRNSDAAEAYRRLAKIDRRFLTEHLKKTATLEQQLGRNQQAQQAGLELIAAAPGNPEHLQFYAELCFAMGLRDEGLKALRRAVRANPSDEAAILTLAHALVNQNEMAEAIELYWRAFEDAADAETQGNIVRSLADLHLRTNRFDQLIQKLELRARELSRERESVICLATAYQVAGDVRSARQRLDGLLASDSRDVVLLSELARMAEQDGDLDAAADYQRRLNMASPSDDGKVKLAGLLLKLGDISEAEALWMRLAETNSDPSEIYQSIDSLISIESVDAARQLCQRILEREPDNWDAMIRLGMIEWSYGDRKVAISFFDRLLKLNLPLDQKSARLKRTSLQQNTVATPASHQNPAMRRMEFAPDLMDSLADTPYPSASMPTDFGDARIVCVTALLLDAQQEDRDAEYLATLERNADLSLLHFWDANTVHFLLAYQRIDDEESYVTKNWFDFVARAAESGDVEVMSLYLQLAAEVFSEQSDAEDNRGSREVSGTKPRISPQQAELVIHCYEMIAKSHFNWLENFTPDMLVALCDEVDQTETLTPMVKRLRQNTNQPDQLRAALELSLELESITAEEALQLLTQIANAEQTKFSGVRMADNFARYSSSLSSIADLADDANDFAAVCMTVDWWLKFRVADQSAVKTSSATSTVAEVARELVAEVVNSEKSTARGVQRSGRGSRSKAAEFLGIENYFTSGDGDFISTIGSMCSSPERHKLLSEWCEQQSQISSVETRFWIHLLQAMLCQQNSEPSVAIMHVIHAAEAAPRDVSLRLAIVMLCEKRGQLAEALEVLEQIPDSDPVLLSCCEIKALDLALKLKNTERAKSAALRLYGMNLDQATEEYLAAKLQQLGLKEQAAQVKSRTSRTAVVASPTSSPLDLLDLYEKQGNLQAAAQIAQQLIRRTTGGGTPWRRARGPTPEQIKARAYDVLKRSGELDLMIERQKAQLEKSPHSRLLLKTLQEYLEVADRSDEATEIVRRLIGDQTGRSPESMLMIAEGLIETDQFKEGCDKLLELLKKHPKYFWEEFGDLDLLAEQNRLAELVDAILESEQGRSQSYASTVELTSILKMLLTEKSLQPKAAQLLEHVLQLYPGYTMYFLWSVHDLDPWKSPELYSVLLKLYLPLSAEQLTKPQFAWPTEYEFLGNRFGFVNDNIDSGGNLVPLHDALKHSDQRRKEFEQIVTQRKSELPDWKAANGLLIVSALHGQIEIQRVEQLVDEMIVQATEPIPPAVADNLAAMMSAASKGLKPASLRLLQNSLEDCPEAKRDLSSPAAVRLMRLYVDLDQFDAGREFVLHYDPDVSGQSRLDDSERSGRQRQAIGSRLAASEFLVKLDCPLDALAILDLVSESQEIWYFSRNQTPAWGARPTRGSSASLFSAELRTDAFQAIRPQILAAALQRAGESETLGDMMPFDVRLSLTLGETRLPLLQCDAVNLLRTSSKRASDVTAMPRLSQLLTEAMQQESPDSTLILLGLSFVLKSGDEQLIAKITPGIESYLQRRGHASRRDLNSSIQVRLQHADIALAVLASSLKEDVAKLPLVIELFNRAEDSARQASASSYLAAVLYAKGEYLRKRGDLAGAENAWNEMLESIIAGPDAVLDAMRSVQPSKNGASPAFDLGAELRRTLLKPAVP